ncbi:MAG: hypothetical protein ACLR7Z_14970 [Bilophila wadsworthia]
MISKASQRNRTALPDRRRITTLGEQGSVIDNGERGAWASPRPNRGRPHRRGRFVRSGLLKGPAWP